MAFISAMDSTITKIAGENGAAELSTTGDVRVDIFFALVRGLPDERLFDLVAKCFANKDSIEPHELAADLVLLLFQTRDCRGGKGERALFIKLFFELYGRFPDTMLALLPLVPQYGSWKDLVLLSAKSDEKEAWAPVKATALGQVATQLFRDAAELADKGPGHADLSLAAKWAPREAGGGKHKGQPSQEDPPANPGEDLEEGLDFGKGSGKGKGKGGKGKGKGKGKGDHGGREGPTPSALAKEKEKSALAKCLAERMFPGSPTARAEYRKLVAALNRALGTVEVKMCGNEWGAIEPARVPSLALMRMRKALLNEKVEGPPPTPKQRETGNRHPEDAARVGCRKRVRAALLETGLKKLKGKQLFPHEIVAKCLAGRLASEVELEIFDAQWAAIREGTQEGLNEAPASAATAAATPVPGAAAEAPQGASGGEEGASVDLGKVVSLVDVSGSMSGIPMQVAIALGILVSELASPAFRGRFLTFHERPSWVKLEAGAPVAAKVAAAARAPWGMSTDFAAAMDLVLEVCVANKLAPGEIPDLLVLSDMQFDEAAGKGAGWGETHHERVVRNFAEAGVRVCGQPWPAPRMTYWNLRGDTVGFPASVGAPNVSLVSGFSPALLKLLLAGEPLDGGAPEEEEDEGPEKEEGAKPKAEKKKAKKNPMDTVRRALDAPGYDAVRAVLSASSEGCLAAYSFAPPVEPVEPAGGGGSGSGSLSEGYVAPSAADVMAAAADSQVGSSGEDRRALFQDPV